MVDGYDITLEPGLLTSYYDSNVLYEHQYACRAAEVVRRTGKEINSFPYCVFHNVNLTTSRATMRILRLQAGSIFAQIPQINLLQDKITSMPFTRFHLWIWLLHVNQFIGMNTCVGPFFYERRIFGSGGKLRKGATISAGPIACIRRHMGPDGQHRQNEGNRLPAVAQQSDESSNQMNDSASIEKVNSFKYFICKGHLQRSASW